MKIYQIYVPELAAYAKFKVLEPENLDEFISNYKKENKKVDILSFRKKVVETFVFNLKSDITDALRLMSRDAAQSCLDSLFTGCIMLNPGLDIDMWLNIAYTGIPEDIGPMDLDDDLSSAFLNSLKNMRSKYPKLGADDYPFETKDKVKPKIKQISKIFVNNLTRI